MRYIVIGAGAIGGVIGARLAQHSTAHPPVLIARGDNGQAMRANGLRLRTPDEDVTIPITVAAGPGEVSLRVDDVLVLVVKTQQALGALQQWVDAPVVDESGERVGTAGELLPILTAMNGVESERLAARLFDRVYAVCVWLPAVHLEPGEVILRIAPVSGTFILGRYGRSMDAADHELLSTLEADWTSSGFRIHLVDEPMRWKYQKLLGNLSNSIQALVGAGGALRAAGRACARRGCTRAAAGRYRLRERRRRGSVARRRLQRETRSRNARDRRRFNLAVVRAGLGFD